MIRNNKNILVIAVLATVWVITVSFIEYKDKYNESIAELVNSEVNATNFNIETHKKFVGTWVLISVSNIYPDGTESNPYGTYPEGLLVTDADGNYALQILKTLRPIIVAGNKNKGTPEEYAAMVKGSNSHFGKYSVDRPNRTITFNIEHAFYPNWENKIQVRSYMLDGNILKYIVTNTTQGGDKVIAEIKWQKLN